MKHFGKYWKVSFSDSNSNFSGNVAQYRDPGLLKDRIAGGLTGAVHGGCCARGCSQSMEFCRRQEFW